MGDQRNQKLPFMFETWPSGATEASASFILPLQPETYRATTPTRSSLAYTKGGVHEERSGLSVRKFSIGGTFGYQGTLPGGHGRHLSGIQACGWELFKEIESMFTDFYEQFGTAHEFDQAQQPELRYYNFTDEEYYVVQVQMFEIVRNVQRRHLYQYKIELAGIRKLDEKRLPDSDLVFSSLNDLAAPNTEDLTFWGNLLEGYQAVSTTIIDALSSVDDLKGEFDIISSGVVGFQKGISDFIEAPFGLVGSAIDNIEKIIGVVEDFTEIPYEITGYLRSEELNLKRMVTRSDLFHTPEVNASGSDTIDTIDQPDVSTTKTVHNVVTAPLPSGQTSIEQDSGSVAVNSPEDILFDQDLESAIDSRVKITRIKDNETLEYIAYREMGDSLLWVNIAILNELEYPYIVPPNSKEAYSPPLAEDLAYLPIPEETRIIYADNITVQVGEAVVIEENGIIEGGVVEEIQQGVNGQEIVVESPLKNSFSIGAYITSHETKLKVLISGDEIKVPGEFEGIPVYTTEDEGFEAFLFGIDEYLTKEGMQKVSTTGAVERIVGLSNLEMQLSHRLSTARGALAHLGHPQYGSSIPSLIGKAGTDVWLERIRIEAKLSVLEDPRIVKVNSLTVEIQGSAAVVEAFVLPVDQSTYQKLNLVVS